MVKANRELAELILNRLSEQDELLDRFLESPSKVIAEITDEPVDEATFEWLGERLRETLSEKGRLSDSELDSVAAAWMENQRIARLSPTLGKATQRGYHYTDIIIYPPQP
jgi:hypothetical protein